jgi:hypothetical protein
VTSRIIEGEAYYLVPLVPCERPSAIMRIAAAAQIPIGVERLPDECRDVTPRPAPLEPARERVNLTGKRVGDALNELVASDPRYAWVESDGVIVIVRLPSDSTASSLLRGAR